MLWLISVWLLRCCCCHANMQSVPLASSRMRRIRAVFVLFFFSHKWREAAYCIAAVEANASSVLLITCTQTESSTHWHTPLGWAANSVPKWICLFFFSICLMTASLVLYFSHFIPLLDSFSVALIHFQRQQHSWFLLSISESVFVTKYGLTGTYFTGNYCSFGICLMQ